MVTRKFLFFLCLILFPLFAITQNADSFIQQKIEEVTIDSYRTHFIPLKTSEGCFRKVLPQINQHPDHDSCRNYIERTFIEYFGVDNVFRHNFEVGNCKGLSNVLALKKSATGEKDIIIVCAHYDSNNNRETSKMNTDCSPGANDNGTGLAAILEIARILASVQLSANVLFAAWDYEEEFTNGFPSGSDRWFNEFVVRKPPLFGNNGKRKIFIDDIKATINFDMFGRPQDSLYGKPLLWACSGHSQHAAFIDSYVQAFDRYVPEIKAINKGKIIYSDHYTFAARKIPAVVNLESGYYRDDYYHTCSDYFDNPVNINFPFATSVTRGGLAFLLELAGIYEPIVAKKKQAEMTFKMVESDDLYRVETESRVVYAQLIDRYNKQVQLEMNENTLFFTPEHDGVYSLLIYDGQGWNRKNYFLKNKKGSLKKELSVVEWY